MRIDSLVVKNLRAISRFQLSDLQQTVVIAGPNGCGKSAVLDAIRLLKSSYGGYQDQEVIQWFTEFHIDIQRRQSSSRNRLFRDASSPVVVEAQITLSRAERQLIDGEAEQLIEESLWRRALHGHRDSGQASAIELEQHGSDIRASAIEGAPVVREAAAQGHHLLRVTVTPDLLLTTTPSPLFSLLFQTYEPGRIGVIEYQSATRFYRRESLGEIQLSTDDNIRRRQNHTLYNWEDKYRNVKTELASTYVRDLLAREAGTDVSGSNLNEVLAELFQTFFPGKAYHGPRPMADGSVAFPVVLSSGAEHDIDDLSSGEKEVLYGYLRMRATAHEHSVILLDEPELHLNPSLIRGLPDFYHRHLGMALDNQLWLVTHSDTLLREAVGRPGFSVFHMSLAEVTGVGNQASPIVADNDLDQAVIDLVGDLATYRPWAPVVLVEGAGSDFDVQMCRRLFPEITDRLNVVSAGSRQRVGDLYRTLLSMVDRLGLQRRFYAVVDRDLGDNATEATDGVVTWDRYHIENYLLEPKAVRAAVVSLTSVDPFQTDASTKEALRASARSVAGRVVVQRLQRELNGRLVSSITVAANPSGANAVAELRASTQASVERFDSEAASSLAGAALEQREAAIRSELDSALESDEWLRLVPGRSVLGAFAAQFTPGVRYEAFRNIVLEKMVDFNLRPAGMASVFASFLPDSAGSSASASTHAT